MQYPASESFSQLFKRVNRCYGHCDELVIRPEFTAEARGFVRRRPTVRSLGIRKLSERCRFVSAIWTPSCLAQPSRTPRRTASCALWSPARRNYLRLQSYSVARLIPTDFRGNRRTKLHPRKPPRPSTWNRTDTRVDAASEELFPGAMSVIRTDLQRSRASTSEFLASYRHVCRSVRLRGNFYSTDRFARPTRRASRCAGA